MAQGLAPLVSILMPCRDAGASLAAAISSVRVQALPEWELLIADDGSQDDSLTIARAAAREDVRLRVLERESGETSGAAAARNRALAMAKGRYIAFLDADDLWLPEKLSRQIGAMRAGGWAFSYTGYVIRRAGRADLVLRPPKALTRKALLRGNLIGCLTAVYDTAQLGKVPMPDIPRRHDYALWLKLLERVDEAHGLPEPLAVHVRRPGSLSSDPIRATLGTWSMLRHSAGLGRGKAAVSLGRHLAQRLLRG